MTAACRLTDIVKTYPHAPKPALDHVDLLIEEGESFGLLGPNGAGKTTLISILSGLVIPESGSVQVFNEKPVKKKLAIGLVPQEIALYPSLTARENLFYFGILYGIEKSLLMDKIDFWLSKLGLDNQHSKRVSNFSGGMKRRLNLIAALLHDPKLLILDEPTVGIDIHSKMIILEQLGILNQEGLTLIYTSHQFEEAEKICNTIAILDEGKICWKGTQKDLIAHHGSKSLQDFFIDLTGKEMRD